MASSPLDWDVVSTEEFEKLPPRQPQRRTSPEWDSVLDELMSGKPVRLRYADEKDLRGKRLSLGRRAAQRGITVEIRYGEGFLIVRKSGERGEPNQAASPPTNGRRRRRTTSASSA